MHYDRVTDSGVFPSEGSPLGRLQRALIIDVARGGTVRRGTDMPHKRVYTRRVAGGRNGPANVAARVDLTLPKEGAKRAAIANRCHRAPSHRRIVGARTRQEATQSGPVLDGEVCQASTTLDPGLEYERQMTRRCVWMGTIWLIALAMAAVVSIWLHDSKPFVVTGSIALASLAAPRLLSRFLVKVR